MRPLIRRILRTVRLNTLLPDDAIWWHGRHQAITRTWLLIIEDLWNSSENNFTAGTQASILYYGFENHTLKITAKDQWVKWYVEQTVDWLVKAQCVVVITWSIFAKILTTDTKSLTSRETYGLLLYSKNCDLSFASISAVLYSISCDTGQHHLIDCLWCTQNPNLVIKYCRRDDWWLHISWNQETGIFIQHTACTMKQWCFGQQTRFSFIFFAYSVIYFL